MAITAGGDLNVVPAPAMQTSPSNFINFIDGSTGWEQQYLPDLMAEEVERYGKRTVSGFLAQVGAEEASAADSVVWSEQGRLHLSYDGAVTNAGVFTVASSGTHAIRLGATVLLSDNVDTVVPCYVSAIAADQTTATLLPYEAATVGAVAGFGTTDDAGGNTASLFVYGSEFKKGTNGMQGSLEADDIIFENSPIIIKDKYAVSGSDMAQIGWIEVTTENGASGYLWYMKSEHETRLRFDDYLETAMIEAVPAEAGSGAQLNAAGGDVGNKGSEGIFHVVSTRGNVWGGGNPTTLTEFDTIVSRLDKQGSIEENVIFVDRDFSFDIDDMLASLNGFVVGGASNSASFGLFDNDDTMALNLGFTGFRRGYDFYKSDWKYLNDPTMRGGLSTVAGSGRVNGLLVPAGSTSVYDQILGKNAKRPFLHVRYRASETEDRRYKTWITGSAGGAQTSDLDAMEVNFLSERAVCTLGANNFFIFSE